MIGKNVKNLLIAAGLASAVFAAVPTISQASRYTGTKPQSIAVNDMTVDVPVVTASTTKHTKPKKHKKLTAATATKKHATKKKTHTTTITYKHHHHKKAVTAAKTKKHTV